MIVTCDGRRRIGLRPEAGQTLAEFALIALLLMLIVLGIVDLGRAVYARNVIANAAREGARYGVVFPNDAAGIRTAAEAMVLGMSRDPSVLQIEIPSDAGPEYVRVRVSYTFHPVALLIANIVDGGSGDGLRLSAQSTMRVEVQ